MISLLESTGLTFIEQNENLLKIKTTIILHFNEY